MECPSPPADDMHRLTTHERPRTTQSESVTPGPSFADANNMMLVTPQQMDQDCQPPMEQSSRFLPLSHSSQTQSNSYTSPESLAYHRSPLSSQLVARQQTWTAPQTSSWAGEALDHVFAEAEAPRVLPWNNLSQRGAQNWDSPQQYQQEIVKVQAAYYQPSYGSATEQLPSYGQRRSSVTTEPAHYYSYHGTSQAVSHAPDFPPEGYAAPPGSAVQVLSPYRRSQLGYQPSPPNVDRSLVPASAHHQFSSPQTMQDEAERLQAPPTPCSEFGKEPVAAHYAETLPDSFDPQENEDKTASGVPESPIKSVETPYAQLIYQAFMSSPRRALKLQEIYQWFLENTDKGQPGQGKGWQNSIRHNLSMNGAFERRPIKGDDNDGGEDCPSPSGASKQATEWVLQDWAIRQGVQSTTRYRNSARRSQNKKLRGKGKVDASSRRPSKRQTSSRSNVQAYCLPPPSRFDIRDYQSQGYYGQCAPEFDTPAEQLGRLSLAPRADAQRRALYFTGGSDYEQAGYHSATTLGTSMETSMHSSYSSAPLSYSSELFMPSVPGAPTVTSEDDVNEVITPEPSFSILEPAVLLHGDSSLTSLAPTSNPYGSAESAYYHNSATATDPNVLPRYTMGDVAGVCDENMLRSCGWEGCQPSHHQ